ncbi:MAG: TetR/AcrR family transcriptional regulator [Pedobacter sp.]|nr:TetR/AcrR family transcriptional regulator [Pedobacter sp.]
MTKSPSSDRHRVIIEAALACFSRHGVEATTIDMIREASGASVGSLYHRFGNKEGIAAEVYMQGLRDFRASLESRLPGVRNLEDAVRAVIDANIDWIVANPDWARFVFNHRMVLAQADREKAFVEETTASTLKWWADMLTLPGAEALASRKSPVYASVLTGAVHDYSRHWLEGRRKTSPDALRAQFAAAAHAGLLACAAAE